MYKRKLFICKEYITFYQNRTTTKYSNNRIEINNSVAPESKMRVDDYFSQIFPNQMVVKYSKLEKVLVLMDVNVGLSLECNFEIVAFLYLSGLCLHPNMVTKFLQKS